ncbi:MAG: TPM domain-containing protein [Bacillota bacterium]
MGEVVMGADRADGRVRRKRALVMATWAIAVMVAAASQAGAAAEFPAPAGYVNDFAGVLSGADSQRLEELCRSLEARTGAEMAIVTVRTTGEESIQMYAVKLFQTWGIGKKGEDNGLLILAAIDDRRVWVEVGYGLEGVLTDGKVGAILDRHLVPAFKEGRYGDGMWACARALAGEIEAAYAGKGTPAPGQPVPAPTPAAASLLFFGLGIAVFVAGVYLLARATFPRCPSCRARLLVREKVLVPATLLAAGMALVLYTCPRCGYSREKRRVLPRLIPVHTGGTSRRGGTFWGPFGGSGWTGRSRGGFGGFGGAAAAVAEPVAVGEAVLEAARSGPSSSQGGEPPNGQRAATA